MEDVELADPFTEDSQTEKERYEILAGHFSYIEQELKKPGATLATLHEDYYSNIRMDTGIHSFAGIYDSGKNASIPVANSPTRRQKSFLSTSAVKKLSYIDKPVAR